MKMKKFVIVTAVISISAVFVAANAIIFPQAVKKTSVPENTVRATVDEAVLELKSAGTVISEKEAIASAKEFAKQRKIVSSVTYEEYDVETADVCARYVTQGSGEPFASPIWVLLFSKKYDDYVFQYHPEVNFEDISHFAVDKGLVWQDEEGRIFGRYDKENECYDFLVAEIEAVSGELVNFKTYNVGPGHEMQDWLEYLERQYKADFEIET